MTAEVKTTCPYCGVGCGVIASRDGDVRGDPDHPANFGRLCSKGAALADTIGLEGRILHPLIDRKRASWDAATDLVAERFSETVRKHGPDSVAFYVSGQLLTEDYYVANKLMKGYIGSANIDTNSRLCMASTVAGHKRAFGADLVPGCYDDLELADTLVLVGSNLAWCHPVLFQRIEAARRSRPEMKIIAVDPRQTATSALSDLHLAITPGSDVALFNGLLCEIENRGLIDADYAAAHVSGLTEAIAAAKSDLPKTTGLSQADLRHFYDLWTGTERVVTVFSQGVNQSSSGTDKVNAILNCHLATGRIGRPGTGPFSVTGQPNAMGGREVGGLANTLACHLDIDNPQHRSAVQDFWRSPTICKQPGLKAVDLFSACASGMIKALWVMSTNPAVSMPRADAVRDAIRACEFTVVSDIVETDTTELADVILPAAGWGEKSGTVTNSERRISRQRAFLPVPGEARPDWQIICDVAHKMGWKDDFYYPNPAMIFQEHAALSQRAESLGSDFDISGLTGLTDEAYEALEPTRWPLSHTGKSTERFFNDGGFFTPDGKARAVPVRTSSMAQPVSEEFPFRLNTGRIRDQWHTMTRTARANRLNQHIAEPFVEVHPSDAAKAGIADAQIVRVITSDGEVLVRALITDRVPRGTLFAPMHWTAQTASRGRVCSTVTDAVDPVSGQPELKGSVAHLAPFEAAWYGFALTKTRPELECAYWARAACDGGWRVELADAKDSNNWDKTIHDLLGEGAQVSFSDPSSGSMRVAVLSNSRVNGLLFVSRDPVEVARAWLIERFAAGGEAAELLAGRPGGAVPEKGAIICSCNDVGINEILGAIDNGAFTIDTIGAVTRAGTTCGSCRSELSVLLAQAAKKVAAE